MRHWLPFAHQDLDLLACNQIAHELSWRETVQVIAGCFGFCAVKATGVSIHQLPVDHLASRANRSVTSTLSSQSDPSNVALAPTNLYNSLYTANVLLASEVFFRPLHGPEPLQRRKGMVPQKAFMREPTAAAGRQN